MNYQKGTVVYRATCYFDDFSIVIDSGTIGDPQRDGTISIKTPDNHGYDEYYFPEEIEKEWGLTPDSAVRKLGLGQINVSVKVINAINEWRTKEEENV